VDKPAGITSHDVIDLLRDITGEGRIGHAGTLDPAATGLMLVCVGPATKRSEKLTGHDKTYEASIHFGYSTTTDDAEGSPLRYADIPAAINERDYAKMMLESFLGEQLQLPPQFAAIKKDGKKAYELARKGEVADLKPREICLHELELLDLKENCWKIRASVSKGTYLRAFARDLGEACDSAAHLGALRRTKIGRVGIEQALTLEQLASVSDISKYWLTGDILL
jgi:tRNA pseudouridine55 synthase